MDGRERGRRGGYIPEVELERYDLLAAQGERERAISALQCRIYEQAATIYRVSLDIKTC